MNDLDIILNILLELGLIEISGYKDGEPAFSVTEAGRKALKEVEKFNIENRKRYEN